MAEALSKSYQGQKAKCPDLVSSQSKSVYFQGLYLDKDMCLAYVIVCSHAARRNVSLCGLLHIDRAE